MATIAGPLLLLCLCTAAHAGTVTWTGPAAGDWSDPHNWSGGALPGPTDDVVTTSTPVTLTHSAGETSVASLSLTGTLRLTGGTLSLSRPSRITGDLVVESGGTLSAVGTAATLSVTGSAAVRGGSVLALDGAHIALPNASQYAGSGLLRAAGPGSLLEVSGLTNIGIPDPSPLSGLLSAVSREFSAYVGAESDPGDLSIGNAVTREFSVFVGAETDPGDLSIGNAVTREFSVFVGAESDPGDLDIGNAVSREFSVFVGAETSRDLPSASAVSREVSLQNQAP